MFKPLEEPTSFGRFLGITELPKRDEDGWYVITFTPSAEMVNSIGSKGTTHGGLISAILVLDMLKAVSDEAFGLGIYSDHGDASATTGKITTTIDFGTFVRPGRPITFKVKVDQVEGSDILVIGKAMSGEKEIAALNSTWHLRKPKT